MGRIALVGAFVGGLCLVVVSVTADALGLGSGGFVFGWEQMVGVALGTGVSWFSGLALLGWRPPRQRDAAPEPARRQPTPLSI